MGAFAEIGARLIERGYAAVPIMPGTKEPGVLRKNGEWVGLPSWQTRYNGNGKLRQRWAEGDAGIGVVGGPASHGAVAIDIDTDDPAIRAALNAVLPERTVRKIGRRGETLFYYAPHVLASRKWIINGKTICELIGPGRQTVLPPTVHPDTKAPYRWTGSRSLNSLKPSELPKLPADIVDRISAALVGFGHINEEPAEPVLAGEETPHRQLNDAAMANFTAWVPVLPLHRLRAARGGYEAAPTWRPSSSGLSDDERALNLKIHPRGIKDFGADKGYTPLDLVMVALDCDLDHAFGFLADRLGWSNDVAIEVHVGQPRTEPEPEPPADPDPLARIIQQGLASVA